MKDITYVLLASCLALATPGVRGGERAPTSAASSDGSFSGKVVETTNAAGYTYILVDTGKKRVWAAAPAFAVKPGDSAAVRGGMAMDNYHSKTLNRDFEVVYFAGGVAVNGAPAGAGGAPAGLPKNHPPIGGAAAAPNVDLSGIKKAEGGQTVAEIVAGRTKLGGQPVTVRGKVVKYNAMILGKNWLHIRDGTGSDGTNDLLVTTTTPAKVGDTVLVTGVVALDKDFGAGYKYAVLLENAKVKVE